MNEFTTENFRFRISVVKSDGYRNGHEVGDTYSCEYGCPDGLRQKICSSYFL
jgi:hypothetical protein